jgi:hypothetical protein
LGEPAIESKVFPWRLFEKGKVRWSGSSTPRRMMLERGGQSNWAKKGVIRDVFWEWIADSMPEESKIEEVFFFARW